ncbi:MAG: hypothetical protein QXI19_09330, partial [Candidatus Caldarchaeum sp.]
EEQIEDLYFSDDSSASVPTGQITPNSTLSEEYIQFLTRLLPEGLAGFRIVIDCANGSASALAPRILQLLGAEIITVGAEPNGDNINVGCGATFPETMQKAVLSHKADVGIALDGDADRCIFCDEKGTLVNGDRSMGIWAVSQQNQGNFNPPIVVGTVMTNGALEKALASYGIQLVRTPVGDRCVAQKIQETGAKIGGEQSGHIIFSEISNTGDGLITMLQILRIMKLTLTPLSQIQPVFFNYPQVLVNLRVTDPRQCCDSQEVKKALKEIYQQWGDSVRIVIRPSGTQPLCRVMVEGLTLTARNCARDRLVQILRSTHQAEIVSETDLTHALGD